MLNRKTNSKNKLYSTKLKSLYWQRKLLATIGLVVWGLNSCVLSPTPVPDATTAVRLLSAKRYEQAVDTLSLLLQAYPDSFRWQRLRGYAYDELKQYEAGIADFSQVLSTHPTDVASLNNRGYAYYQIGKSAQALRDYSRAIELQPTFTSAHSNRALLLVALKRYTQALADIHTALSQGDTQNSTIHNLQGYCQLQLGQPELAIRAFNKAIHLDTSYSDARRNRAEAYTLLQVKRSSSARRP